LDLTPGLLVEGDDERPEVRRLLANIKRAMPRLKRSLEGASGHGIYEDKVYRFYHHSWKVFLLQQHTLEIVDALRSLAPKNKTKSRSKNRTSAGLLNPSLMKIVADGTGRRFKSDTNAHWPDQTRPIVEAFFHAYYFLQMVVKYGLELKRPPALLPSGWAAVLYLYNMR
jgi:hypothetical protein